MEPKMFFRITKIDAKKREVYGTAVREELDNAGEIFDYSGSKPYFKQWSDDVKKDSGGKSLGNLRAMHGNVAAGKVIALDFLDKDQRIDIGTKIVDDKEWEKVDEGVYTGFSIGGKYIKRWKDDTTDGATRYIARPSEISLVDRPAVPSATFSEVIKRGFDVVKLDGAVEHRDFLPTRAEQVEYLTKAKVTVDPKASDDDVRKLYRTEQQKAAAAGGGAPSSSSGSASSAAVAPSDLTVPGTDAEVIELAKVLNENKMTVGQVLEMVKSKVVQDKPKEVTPEAIAARAIELGKARGLPLTKDSDPNLYSPFIEEATAFVTKEVEDAKKAQLPAIVVTVNDPGLLAMLAHAEETAKGMAVARIANRAVALIIAEKKLPADTKFDPVKDAAALKPYLEKALAEPIPVEERLLKGLSTGASLLYTVDSMCRLCDTIGMEEKAEADSESTYNRLKSACYDLARVSLDYIDEQIEEAFTTDESKKKPAYAGYAAFSARVKDLVKLLEEKGGMAKRYRFSTADRAVFQKCHDYTKMLGLKCKLPKKADGSYDIEAIEKMTEDDLKKAGASMSGAHTACVANIHNCMKDLGANCTEDEMEDKEPGKKLDKLDQGEMAKIIADAIKAATDPLKAEVEALKEKMAKTPAPSTVSLRLLGKAQDSGMGGDGRGTTAEVKPVLGPDGKENKSASLIKAAHAAGPSMAMQK